MGVPQWLVRRVAWKPLWASWQWTNILGWLQTRPGIARNSSTTKNSFKLDVSLLMFLMFCMQTWICH
jgi:hypothetical protein